MRPRHLARRAIIAALLAACSSGPLVVHVPFREGDRAAIVVVEQGDKTEAYALDTSMRDMTPILKSIAGFKGSPSIRVTSLSFREPLTDLNLTAGPIVVSAGQRTQELGTELDRLGLRPFVQQSIIEGDNASPWETVQVLRGEIAAVPLPKKTKCRRLTGIREDLPGDEEYGDGIFRIDEHSGLIFGHRTGFPMSFYRITLDGVERLELDFPAFQPRQGTRGPDGRIWLAGYSPLNGNPSVYAGTVAGGFSPVANPNRFIRRLVAPPSPADDPAELYALGESGSIDRYSAGEWRDLGSLPDVTFGGFGAIAWVGPAELLISALDRSALFRHRDGMLSQETAPFTPDLESQRDQVTAVDWLPDVGALVGLDSGNVFRHSGGRWTQFMEPLIAQHTITGFARFHDGVLIGGDTGAVQQWFPDEGLCIGEDVLFLGQDLDVFWMLPVEGGVLCGGVRKFGGSQQRIFVARVREAVQ